MSYFFIVAGVFIFLAGVYIAIKGRKLKEGDEKFGKFKKATRVSLLIGIAFILFGIYIPKLTDEKKIEIEKKAVTKIEWSLKSCNAKNYDMQKLRQLLEIFQDQCVGWQKYPEAIESAIINITKFKKSKYEAYAQEKLGWYTEIELDIKIKEDAKLPTHLRMVPGHNLHYFIGGGTKPGVLMIKDVTALFLGVPKEQINSDSNTFISNEAYKIADEIITEE